MKSFEQCVREQFKNLWPYKELTGPELAAIILANIDWLTQKVQPETSEGIVPTNQETRNRLQNYTIRDLVRDLHR
jgi:hypothetical protein